MTQLLPDKFVPLRQSLIGQGAEVLTALQDRTEAVGALFIESRQRLPHLTYDSFVLTLDLLYAAGRISLTNGRIVRRAD